LYFSPVGGIDSKGGNAYNDGSRLPDAPETATIAGGTAMPRMIEDLRENLLQQARQLLLEDGGGGLTIRRVAARCHVAVGTVYNYFQSKDELMAQVMLREWRASMDSMHRIAQHAPTVMEGLESMCREVRSFAALYRDVWMRYAETGGMMPQLTPRHALLVGQVQEMVAMLLERHGCLWTEYLPTYLAETVLTASGRGEEGFEQIRTILMRLTAKEYA
jgi:AcrR family transcriptional regulator